MSVAKLCRLIRAPLTERGRWRKWAALKAEAGRRFPRDGCFNLPWMRRALAAVDRVWYGGLLLPALTKVYGGVRLVLETPHRSISGYVLECGERDQPSISLQLNRELFHSLFRVEEPGYHSGGLLCRDRLECCLHILLHETMHLAISVCQWRGVLPAEDDHGALFQRCVRARFGHTDSLHGLVPGLGHRQSLGDLRSRIRAGERAELFTADHRWAPCTVVEKTGDVALVQQGRRRLRVHLGRLRQRAGESATAD